MDIAIFGLGYVGCVSAACLAKQGHQVWGVDVNPTKVDLINKGKSPIVEPKIGEMIAETVEAGNLRATTDAETAIKNTEVALVCVGTPSDQHGGLNLEYIRAVSTKIGEVLKKTDKFYVVAVRSTMLPGSVEEAVQEKLEKASGKKVNTDFGVAINPEFLREGSAVSDYYNPAITLVGASNEKTADIIASLYENIDAPIIKTDIKVAEIEKYVSNVWHAVKVTFGNEIGIICDSLGIDSHKVMEIFLQDTHLNISPKYLKPGFAFGGSCLPKDVRALVHKGKHLDLHLPMLQSIMPSNQSQIDRVLEKIKGFGKKKIGILGLSFKAGTDDMRESPMVTLVEMLIGKGYQISIYDKNVSLARIMGANKEYIEGAIPHISSLLVTDIDEVISSSDIILIGTPEGEFKDVPLRIGGHQQILDLVRVGDNSELLEKENYHGISW